MDDRTFFHATISHNFELLIKRMFEMKKMFTDFSTQKSWFDIKLLEAEISVYVDVKYYRTTQISAGDLKSIANRLAFHINDKELKGVGRIIISCRVPETLQNKILADFGIEIWDRDRVYLELTALSIELREEFEKLLLEGQQAGLNESQIQYPTKTTRKAKQTNPKPKNGIKPITKGADLCQELNVIDCGSGWRAYEKKCEEILRFLFDKDLATWHQQPTTDDTLSRYDLICRIASMHDFWESLGTAFNTRFILFEFKNYCDKIGQNEIYTTEKYLYTSALRSVAIILARNGASDNAITAAKGALREHGKLILILTAEDLCKMLHGKDKDEIPSDYLADILDSWLITLSR